MFLQPFDEVITVVFVVTVDDAVFLTSVDSLEVDLVISKTFFGARSKGRNTVFVPVSAQSSMITPSLSDFSPLSSERLLLLEAVRSDTDAVFVGVPTDDTSDATKAALTSGAKVFQDSKIEAGNKGEGRFEASLLKFNRMPTFWC